MQSLGLKPVHLNDIHLERRTANFPLNFFFNLGAQFKRDFKFVMCSGFIKKIAMPVLLKLHR